MKPVDNAFPFDFGFLEIYEEADRAAGGSKIVKTLGGVLIGEAGDAFQLDYQNILHDEVGKVRPL